MDLVIRFKLPNQPPKSVPLNKARMLIGTLLSNEIIIRASGVDPIHGMIEDDAEGRKVVVDLGSAGGIKVNGRTIDVECPIHPGDVIAVGDIVLDVIDGRVEAAPTPPPPQQAGQTALAGATKLVPPSEAKTQMAKAEPAAAPTATKVVSPKKELAATVRHSSHDEDSEHVPESRVADLLFSPRNAKPAGDVLEVVAYWGSTILDVELYHSSFRGYTHCTIGDPTKAHLLAGGEEDISSHPLASYQADGFKVRLLSGMKAKLRKDGKVGEKDGPAKVTLGRHDLAHITYGAISYFLMFVRPPDVILPPNKSKDPFFIALMCAALLLYFMVVPAIWLTNPKPKDAETDDVWTVVNMPEKEQPEEKIKKPNPPPPKPPVKVAQKETKPKPQPPKPQPPPVQPKKPVEPPKPKPPETKPEPKPVADEKVKQPKATDTLPKEKPTEKAPDKTAALKDAMAKLAQGMPSTGAANPDFKLAGPKNDKPAEGFKSGGVKGSGMGQTGGGRKGTEGASVMGVEGGKRGLASGVNLSKLGLGAGKILNKAGAGAIQTPFASAAGGVGGGSGHLSKTYGLGGMGTGSGLGLAGTGSAINNFGSGSGGYGSGQGGSGGLGGVGLGKGFGDKAGGGGGAGGAGGAGQGRANVVVPPGDPVVDGGLTSQEVQAVIRANLNQIRHCYEQLLQRAPNSTGKIKANFTVGTNGRVTSTGIESSTISDAVMQGCVADKIRRWAFPKPRGNMPVTVTYPFVFNPV